MGFISQYHVIKQQILIDEIVFLIQLVVFSSLKINKVIFKNEKY
ncbi:hypothetical protein SAMN05444146_3174 [Flavobacterium johnsoniae]|uniref:Uncharacterized protein n=1 Tax=Flavobacterium johnsoniae TaxID=986 RepID=A0A1M6YDC0_FLAJO|nr:hypothetical protein SAMN05444388_10789 [Flavobacterium johnsoniae]SHL16005.1 hypothetical protein SAMN05444146_3174 [Flavobacterium johnsoniae]